MVRPLALQHLQPLAKGTVRLVFEHPETPDLLVKVIRPDVLEKHYREETGWFPRGGRYGPYMLFIREIREHVAGYAGHRGSLPFAQSSLGLVDTDLGLGLITRAVRGTDGNLAPTAAKLIATGEYDLRAEAAMEHFLTGLLDSDLVISDLHERNIVYGSEPGAEPRFVMIDGLGSATLVPFKCWSRTLNRRSKVKRVARLRARIARRVTAFREGRPLP